MPGVFDPRDGDVHPQDEIDDEQVNSLGRHLASRLEPSSNIDGSSRVEEGELYEHFAGGAPAEIGGLVAPSHSRGLDSTTTTEHVSDSILPLQQTDGTASSFVRIVKSGAVWSGGGAVAISFLTSPVAAAAHALTTAWTVRNELRNNKESDGDAKSSHSIERQHSYGGLKGIAIDLINSPGLTLAVGTLAYGLAATQGIFQGMAVEALAFSSFVLGYSASFRLANLNYTGSRNRDSVLEKAANTCWELIPERIQNFLKNPAPWFAVGNTALIANTLNFAKLTDNMVPNLLVVFGMALATSGLAGTIRNFFRGEVEDTKPTPLPNYLNSGANFAYATAALAGGNIFLGVANFCWTLSSLCWGRAIANSRAKELSSKNDQ